MQNSTTPQEARSAFLSLPAELRAEILAHLFVSPSGSITLSRTFFHQSPPRYRIFTCDPSGSCEIRLSILRTCKTIYVEASRLLWEKNALDIAAFMEEHSRIGDSIYRLPLRVKPKIRDVAMNLTLLDGRIVLLPKGGEGLILHRIFQELKDIAEFGNLQSVTLYARDAFAYNPNVLRHFDILEIMAVRRSGVPLPGHLIQIQTPVRMLFQEYLIVLGRAGGQAGFLSGLKRKLVIDTDVSTFDTPCGHPMRYIDVQRGNPNHMLRDLNRAWGGELVFNGVVTHHGGETVAAPFEPLRRYGVTHWYYSKDIEAWKAARWWLETFPDVWLTNKRVLVRMGDDSSFWAEVVEAWKESLRVNEQVVVPVARVDADIPRGAVENGAVDAGGL